jgi:hypothetical protein
MFNLLQLFSWQVENHKQDTTLMLTSSSDKNQTFGKFKNFQLSRYITGNPNPNSYCLLNIQKKLCYLFVEELSEEHALWCGESTSLKEYKEETGFDEV